MAQFIGCRKETVAHTGAFFLITDLLIDVRQQLLGLAVLWLGVHQLVENFIGFAVLALIEQGLALAHDAVRAAHHFHVERGRVLG
ncbi:hypothetical protein D3C72_2085400 [compost metagenome]